MQNGSPYAIGPLSVLSVLSACDVGVLWPNGWMDQGEIWHAGTPRPWSHCVAWEPSSPSPKGGGASPIFGQCCGQMAGWIKMPLGREVGLSQSDIVLDGDPATPLKVHGPHFSAHVYCGQTAGWMKMHALGTEVDLSQATFC